MKPPLNIPNGMIAVDLIGGGELVIWKSAYIAGLHLGKILRRRATLAKRIEQREQGSRPRGAPKVSP